MPSPTPSLTLAAATEHVAEHVFGGVPDPQCDTCDRNGVGIELEYLTGTRGFERLTLVEVETLMAGVGPLPAGSQLTLEPGGQLELSTVCAPGLEAACEAAATDLLRLDQHCASRGIDLVALGADPVRTPRRIVNAPRYESMQRYFDEAGSSGRTMMCNTASVQINIGLGATNETARRWQLANALGPTLIAAFANSPFEAGRPSGWKSSRLRSWWGLDPSRSQPVCLAGDPVARWVDYALGARVMLIRTGDHYEPVTEPLTFGAWMAQGHEFGWPSLDDFAYHLTTLFPPVRPKGWFELRMCDALPTPFWHVAVAVVHALLTDPSVADEAFDATVDARELWVDAAQLGLGHPALARSAKRCFALAVDALRRHGASASADVVATYIDRWVARGRCPADDRHDDWRRTGRLVPPRESPVQYAETLEASARALAAHTEDSSAP